VVYLRTVSVYRPVKKRRTKAFFLIALLLAMSFMAGAITEKTIHFLQDVIAVAPFALDGIKEFFKDNFFFKINTAVDQIKWAAFIIISTLTDYRYHSIRGP